MSTWSGKSHHSESSDYFTFSRSHQNHPRWMQFYIPEQVWVGFSCGTGLRWITCVSLLSVKGVETDRKTTPFSCVDLDPLEGAPSAYALLYLHNERESDFFLRLGTQVSHNEDHDKRWWAYSAGFLFKMKCWFSLGQALVILHVAWVGSLSVNSCIAVNRSV